MNILKEKKDIKNKDELFLSSLKKIIEVEHHLSLCSHYIYGLIKNGPVRGKFKNLSFAAKRAEFELTNILAQEGIPFAIKHSCHSCRLKPDNFSIEGAINLSLELVAAAIHYYGLLIKISKKEKRNLFINLLKEKRIQRKDFIREKEYHLNNGEGKVINDFCLPHIISKLWF